MNYKLFIPLVAIVCLLFTACNKDDISPGNPMLLTHEILTPGSVKYEGSSVDWAQNTISKQTVMRDLS